MTSLTTPPLEPIRPDRQGGAELEDEEVTKLRPTLPPLIHTLHQEASSVLSLAADDRWIYSGSQGMDIYVWDRNTYQVVGTLEGHMASVIALEVNVEKKWLFSSSGDSTVRVWDTETFAPIYILTPYSDYDSGDIYSLAFAARTDTLFIGCQNTSLQWFDFSDLPAHPTGNALPSRRPHKFFDSQPQPIGRPPPCPQKVFPSPAATPSSSSNALPGANTPPSNTQNLLVSTGASTPLSLNFTKTSEPRSLSITAEQWIPSAHHGYIYCMAVVPDTSADDALVPSNQPKKSVQLVTGSGDEDVKLWSYTQGQGDSAANISLLHTFHSGIGGVLAILAREGNIYAGCQGGHIKIWDIETKTLVRTIIAEESLDILSLSLNGKELYACAENGSLKRYSCSFELMGCWKGHDGPVLSSIIVPSRLVGEGEAGGRFDLISGASDNNIKIWDIGRFPATENCPPLAPLPRASSHRSIPSQDASEVRNNLEFEPNTDTLLHALSQFISFPSVSNSIGHKEDCRQAAIWLKKCLTQFGAEAQLLYGVEGKNPVVLGTFRGTESNATKPRVLFYGHYDIVATGAASAWEHDPFTLNGVNGYIYGRGVTDNKGPVLAVACAASEMLARRSLDVDVVLLIEGEEEAGSGGFEEAVRKYKDQIGPIDAILVSNSYWIDDSRPCITYGLRGVVHATLEVGGEGPDVHSGVDGGADDQPMMDMVKILARLSDGHGISIPGFYDRVRVPSAEEDEIFKLLSEVTGQKPSYFSTRWREPTLSVHSINDSGLGNPTIIAARVRAKISLRIVPDQDVATIVASLEEHIKSTFESLQSSNSFNLIIDRTADWWIGSFDHPWFKLLERSIYEEWGVQPLRIREGGSIPSVPFLEKEFGCPALHLPMGQSSDHAHLRNERISLINLRKGKAVVEHFFRNISSAQQS